MERSFIIRAQNPTLHRARIIRSTIMEQYQAEQLDEVYIIYTNMENCVTTEPQMMQLLPIVKERLFQRRTGSEYVSGGDCACHRPWRRCLITLFRTMSWDMYTALVESFCSEQNARMMAMEAATDSAQP